LRREADDFFWRRRRDEAPAGESFVAGASFDLLVYKDTLFGRSITTGSVDFRDAWRNPWVRKVKVLKR